MTALALDDYSSAEASGPFLHHKRADPLIICCDTSPTHAAEALRAYGRTPNLRLP